MPFQRPRIGDWRRLGFPEAELSDTLMSVRIWTLVSAKEMERQEMATRVSAIMALIIVALLLVFLVLEFEVVEALASSFVDAETCVRLHVRLMLIRIVIGLTAIATTGLLLVLFPRESYRGERRCAVLSARLLRAAGLKPRVWPREPSRQSLRNVRVLGLILVVLVPCLLLFFG